MCSENIPYIEGYKNPGHIHRNLSSEVFEKYSESKILLVRDVRLYGIKNYINEVIKEIPELKNKNISVNMLMSKIYKLLIVPNNEVLRRINNRIKEIKIDNGISLVGIQVRMGGNLSDYKENFTFIQKGELDELITLIKKEIKKLETKGGKVNIYISSDSTFAINYIKMKINDYPIRYLNNERGHSRNGNTTIIENSLIDLYFLSKSNVLIRTKESSFGLMASYLRYPQKSIEYPNVNPYTRN